MYNFKSLGQNTKSIRVLPCTCVTWSVYKYSPRQLIQEDVKGTNNKPRSTKTMGLFHILTTYDILDIFSWVNDIHESVKEVNLGLHDSVHLEVRYTPKRRDILTSSFVPCSMVYSLYIYKH